ncbi:MAG TPA: site-specific DNA-methyltransferase [Oscillatoriaceae cyanobacterium]
MRSLDAPPSFEAWFQQEARKRLACALAGLSADASECLSAFFEHFEPSTQGFYAGETGGPDDRIRPRFEAQACEALDQFLGVRLLTETVAADACHEARRAGHAAIAAIAQREKLRLALFRMPPLIRASYDLVPLARVPEALQAEVLDNEAQRQAWQMLGLVETDDSRPGLPVDASLFSRAFRAALERALGEDLDGLLIHGDNRQAMRLLGSSFAGRVRCMYWDPPYNRGKDDFVYADTFREGNWARMMGDRLAAARALLAEDGVLFQSIDDREVHRLRLATEQEFGAEHFVANVIWQKKYTRANDARWFSDNHEHLLVFARSKPRLRFRLLPREARQLSAYTNPDGHPKGPWKATPLHAKSGRGHFSYTFQNGVTWSPPPGTFARFSTATLQRLEEDDAIYFGPDGRSVPSRKTFLSETRQGLTPTTLWLHDEVGHTHEANSELKRLFPQNPFNNPKPLRLLERVLTLATGPEDWIADAFAGSGTTGHAVIAMNGRDGGRRRMLLIERESHFESLLKPRLLKALYATEWRDGRPVGCQPQDYRLRVWQLESAERTRARLVVPGTPVDALAFSWDFEAEALVWRWPERLTEEAWWAIAETFAQLGGERVEARASTPEAWILRARDPEGGLVIIAHGRPPHAQRVSETPARIYLYGAARDSSTHPGVSPLDFESAFAGRMAKHEKDDVMSDDFSSVAQEKSVARRPRLSP